MQSASTSQFGRHNGVSTRSIVSSPVKASNSDYFVLFQFDLLHGPVWNRRYRVKHVVCCD